MIKTISKIFRTHRGDTFAVLSIIATMFFFFLPTLLLRDVTGDFINQEVPSYHFAYTNLKQCIIPFWSPYAFSGLPFLFKPDLSIFHPMAIVTMVLNFIFNGSESISITGQLMEFVSILNFCIGAVGIYIFARRVLSLSKIPSVFASLAYALNPFIIFEMHSTTTLQGVALLPWLMYFLILFINKVTFRTFLLVVLGNYILLLGYSYHYVYFLLMELSLVAIYNYKRLLPFFISFIVSIIISGFFLLPYLDIYSKSVRNADTHDVSFHTFAALSTAKIMEIINPISYSTHVTLPSLAQLLSGPALTFGTFVLVFLAFGFLSFKRKPVYLWLVAIFFLSLFYSFGGYIYAHEFFGTFLPPVYKFRFHARAFIVTIFAASLIIALGVQTIKEQVRIKWIEFFFWSFILLAISAFFVGQVFWAEKIAVYLEIYKGTLIALLFIVSSLIITALTIRYGNKGFLILGLIILLIEYNFYFHNFQYFFTNNVRYEQFYKLNSLMPEIPTSNNLFRMYFEGNQFANNTAVFSIANLNGYENSPYPSWYQRFERYGLVRFYQYSNVKYVVTTTDNWQAGIPDVVKIKTIIPQNYPEETFFMAEDKMHYIYEIKNYLPRYYVPEKVQSCDNTECLKKENPPKLVMAKGVEGVVKNPQASLVRINVNEYKSNYVDLSISTPKETFVASSETNDNGWNITINGKPSRIYDTSNGTRGFIVPAGNSIVEMKYLPPTLIPGVISSVAGILLLFVIRKYELIEKIGEIFK